MNIPIPILVTSCWKMRDTWNPYWKFAEKFAPECKKDFVLVTDEYDDALGWDGKKFVVGKDLGYSKNLLKAIEAARGNTVLLTMDDMFLMGKPDLDYIQDKAWMLDSGELGMFRLYPCPGPDTIAEGSSWGVISRDARYRVSTMAALWRKEVLIRLLERTGDPWDFELEGTKHSQSFPEIFASVAREHRPAPWPLYATAVTRGTWSQEAIDLCHQNNIAVSPMTKEERELECKNS